MALPNTNISTSLVGQTLGSGSRDVGALCTHPNINKWSKWKPVRFNKVTGLTEANLQSVSFGLTIQEVSPAQLPSTKALENSMFIGGDYLRPRGGSFNESYRLGDFRNYEHNSIPPISEIILQNWIGGDKPINGNPSFPDVSPLYYCRVIFNTDSNIKLSEMRSASYNNLSNLYLTLVIGANISGMSVTESIIKQSENSVGEIISSGGSEINVYMDTTNIASVMGSITSNIVFVYLAPRITGTPSQFDNGVSIKIYEGLQSSKYNPTYANYGDGGDGGNPTTSTVIGTWNWLSNIPIVYSDGTITFDFSVFNISSVAPGNGDLKMYVRELNVEYTVTRYDKISFNVPNTQTIDTSRVILNLGAMVDPITGAPLTSITCDFYVTSNTPGTITNFNQTVEVIPVI